MKIIWLISTLLLKVSLLMNEKLMCLRGWELMSLTRELLKNQKFN